ncbi:hypothetical protein B5P43_23565 [Bacillus sp. SRB_336]|nr:hypothetical protein B5P43_23565 [Bacillus sp. SRB_336]
MLLAESWSAPLIAAFLDPASYLIEWTPGNQILPISLEPVLDPDDDSAIAAAQLKESPAVAVAGYGVDWSLRVIGGDPALALGRRASEMAFKSRMFTSTIMVHRRG